MNGLAVVTVGSFAAEQKFMTCGMAGALERNIHNELLTRGFSVDVGVVRIEETDEAGKRRQKSYEIDFVVNKGGKRQTISTSPQSRKPVIIILL